MNDVGHDLIARSARDAGALLARASSAARQRGQEDVRGSNRRVRIETHHPCQDLDDGSLLASNEDCEDMGSSTIRLCKRRRVQSVSKWGSSQGSIKTWVLLLVGC